MKKVVLLLAAFFLLFNKVFPQYEAVKTSTKPVIDGVIEELWEGATKFNSFKQIEPDILAEPTVNSEGYFLYDSENIYMAMKLYQKIETIRSTNGRKDGDLVCEADYALFTIDPFNSGNTAYYFLINAVNAIKDGKISEDGTMATDWDGIFYSAVNVSDNYWSVEVQIPLNSISFQNLEVQSWGIIFRRQYAQNQEQITSRLTDLNNPYRLTNLDKINGLKDLKKKDNFRLTPYLYSTNENNMLNNSSIYKGKLGGELLYSPDPTMQIAATINPDYAQLETDKEIINVSDLPTEYPEKRPFFTESSDFYPGSAVNTRNIVDIKTGVKIRKVSELLKYDITGVIDKNDNNWFLTNIKLSDNSKYQAEIIGGLKNNGTNNNYNITTHEVLWLFDKKLTFSNWFGTINNPLNSKNEYEIVNSIILKDRSFDVGIRSHYRSQYYNPNTVGINLLSNFIINSVWLKYFYINEAGIFRKNSFGVMFYNYNLTSPWGNPYYLLDLWNENIFHLGDKLGNWKIEIGISAVSSDKFRYRKIESYNDDLVYEDAISKFVLIDDPANTVLTSIQSDYSKKLGIKLTYSNNHIRKSKADNFESEVYWKIGSSSIIKYSLGYINIIGSAYQDKYEQVIHRLQIEYNITDKLNIRGIIQPNTVKLPGRNEYENRIQSFNVALSWELMPGSFLYFVYNKFKDSEKTILQPNSIMENNQSVIVKFNKVILF